jgi:hypothetical protein
LPPETEDKDVSIGIGDKSIKIPLGPKARVLVLLFVMACVVSLGLWFAELPPFTKGKIKFDRAVAEQMVMASRYLAETPDADVTVATDPGGRSAVRHYHDGNLYAYRTPVDPAQKARGQFVNLTGEKFTPLDDRNEMEIGGMLSTPAFAGTDPARCAEIFHSTAHPGAPDTKQEPLDDCHARLWRAYADGCVNWQLCSCDAGCEVGQDGYPVLHWTACTH